VPRTRLEPERVFSPKQWAEFAKAIWPENGKREIPADEKQEICHAIFDYDRARAELERAIYETNEKSTRRRIDPRAKGHTALSNFIKYARGFREAFSSVEKYLNGETLITEAQQLAEQIYNFQKKIQQELDKKSIGGRPGKKFRNDLVIRLGAVYERLTGKKPTRIVDREGHVSGPFSQFVYAIFRAHKIPEVGLPNAIATAVEYAKNPH
jgi:hypothetical protein